MPNLNTSKFSNIGQQGGWTFWSMMFVMLVVLFFSYIGMQLVPIYGANMNVQNAMSRSLEDENLRTVIRSTIIRKMQAQLYLDGSYKLLNYRNEMLLRRERSRFFLETHYKREIPLFLNFTLVVAFDNVEERAIDP